MKILYCSLLCILSCHPLLSQSTFIHGTITTDDRNQKHPVMNVKVVLFCPNGSVKESVSDAAGHYSFKVDKGLGKIQLFTETGKNTYSQNRKPYEVFVKSKEIKRLEVTAQDTILENFNISREFSSLTMPSIHFKKNSAELLNDSGIVFLEAMLWDNLSMTIELQGHNDIQEKSDLSLQRALAVKTELIKRGHKEQRITATGLGSTQPIVPAATIKKTVSASGKEILHQKNRRITFKVLSFY